MTEKHLLITGRPGSGKTELLVAFANMHPETTLFYSAECTEEMLKNEKGLNENVAVADSSTFKFEQANNYTTICVDYLELLPEEILEKVKVLIKQNNLQIIVASYVKRGDNEVIDRIDNSIRKRIEN